MVLMLKLYNQYYSQTATCNRMAASQSDSTQMLQVFPAGGAFEEQDKTYN